MKKLMLFAAVAAMVGGANAADVCVQCPLAYKIKVIVRTTTAQDVTNKSASVCGCFRKPDTRRYIGYYFGESTAAVDVCGKGSCGCVDWSAGEEVNLWLAMWDYDTKKPVTPDADINLLNRIGFADTSKCEIVFDTTYENEYMGGLKSDLRFAGFGTVGRRSDGAICIKSMEGFCAGTVPGLCSTCSESICGSPVECETTAVNVWKICAEQLDVSNMMTTYITAAYGKWAMQWDAEMAKRLQAGRTALTGGGEGGDEPTGFTPAGYVSGVAKKVTAEGASGVYGEVEAE